MWMCINKYMIGVRIKNKMDILGMEIIAQNY